MEAGAVAALAIERRGHAKQEPLFMPCGWLPPSSRDEAARTELARRCVHRLRGAGLELLVGALLHSGALPLSDHRGAWSCERSWAPLDVCCSRSIRRIELIGAPGVGKSTISRLLVENGGLRRLPKVVADDEVAAASGTYPAFESLVRRIEPPGFLHAHGPAVRTRIAMLNRASREPGDQVFVDDEGLLQRGLNLAQLKPRHELFFDYYWTVPLPCMVIALRARPALISARNRERGHKSPGRDRGAQRFFDAWVTDIATSILKARGVACIVLENDDTADAGARRILDAVRQLGRR
jgi:hypothetical protein